MLTDDEVEKLLKAGKIVRAVRERAPSLVFEGAKVSDICDRIEEEIRVLGGEPAFPCNVGINSVGAHYTSPPDDATLIPRGALVKIDLGAHIDGYVADSAITVSVDSEYEDMIRVANEALEKALQAVTIGGKISEVGSVVEKTIRSRGFRPISNLTGHQISRYTIHAGVSIPNVRTIGVGGWGRFEQWSVYAIEPFVTPLIAGGEVKNGPLGNILHIVRLKGPKEATSRKLFDELYRRYKTLPFARRWAAKIDSFGLAKLLEEKGTIYEYPVLVEVTGQTIAQAEHTILTTNKEVIVTT
jgi:methionyl aminopeptidase